MPFQHRTDFSFPVGDEFSLVSSAKDGKHPVYKADSFGMMFAVNIYMLSVTNFRHFVLHNLVKNIPLFIPVVSALCHYFLGFIDTSDFFLLKL